MSNQSPADTRLHEAAQDGRLDRLRELLEAGAEVNRFDDLNKTPLHYAVEREDLEMIRALLSAGADVNAHDNRDIGNTPLRQVAQTCSLDVARVLIQAGADPTIEGWMRLTALDKAASRKRGDGPAVYKLLLDAANTRR
jgi:ankyrin repeat protein